MIEILAPAGSMECLRAALLVGADAVYVGGSRFGARAYAENFTEEELLSAIDEVHLHGKKIYMTVNTLLKDRELEEEFYEYFLPYYERGVDAVIVQDLGLLRFIRNHFPDMAIHASTQMTITGEAGVRFLQEEKVQRVVPARELSIEEVRQIAKTGVEVECFVHGALCYCYSGQCLYSSLLGGRSGNRGQCAQPCRLPYQVDGKKPSYVMSLKDICTLETIPELVEAGVMSFKIEGRMKKPEYVAAVTRMYRKYTDLYLRNGRKGYHVSQKDKEELMDIYNRGGFHEGYYHQHNGKDMVCTERPNHAGIPALLVKEKKGRNLFCKALIALQKGDVLEIGGENYTLGRGYEKGKTVSLTIRQNTAVKKGMVLNRIRNEVLLKGIAEEMKRGQNKILISGEMSVCVGEPVKLTLSCREVTVQVSGAVVEVAKNQPVDRVRIEKQMQKTGESVFSFESLQIALSGNVFLPMQALNELRRNGLEELKKALVATYRRMAPVEKKEINGREEVGVEEKEKRCDKKGEFARLSVYVEQAEQMEICLQVSNVGRIYVDSALLWGNREFFLKMEKKFSKKDTELYLAMPYIFRDRTRELFAKNTHILQNFQGFLVRNMETIQFFKDFGVHKPVILDYNMYQFNRSSQMFWREKDVQGMTVPVELNDKELERLELSDMELIVYGRIPMMVSAQCIQNTVYGCSHREKLHVMKDRYQKEFPVKNVCAYCYSVTYNSVPNVLLEEEQRIRALSPEGIRLHFTLEDEEKTKQMLHLYERAFCQRKKVEMPRMEYTKGHFKRGIK